MVCHIHKEIVIAVFLALLITSPLTQARRQNAYYPFGSKTDYRSKLHVLRGLVHRYGRNAVNRIYVVKLAEQNDNAGEPFLYGYWPEDRIDLVSWEPEPFV